MSESEIKEAAAIITEYCEKKADERAIEFSKWLKETSRSVLAEDYLEEFQQFKQQSK